MKLLIVHSCEYFNARLSDKTESASPMPTIKIL